MKYGYARCSLSEEKGQDLNRQIRELKGGGERKKSLQNANTATRR